MPREYVKLPPLEVEPALYKALNNYAHQLGVPRARVIRDILRSFLGPMAATPAALQPTNTYEPEGRMEDAA